MPRDTAARATSPQPFPRRRSSICGFVLLPRLLENFCVQMFILRFKNICHDAVGGKTRQQTPANSRQHGCLQRARAPSAPFVKEAGGVHFHIRQA